MNHHKILVLIGDPRSVDPDGGGGWGGGPQEGSS